MERQDNSILLQNNIGIIIVEKNTVLPSYIGSYCWAVVYVQNKALCGLIPFMELFCDSWTRTPPVTARASITRLRIYVMLIAHIGVQGLRCLFIYVRTKYVKLLQWGRWRRHSPTIYCDFWLYTNFSLDLWNFWLDQKPVKNARHFFAWKAEHVRNRFYTYAIFFHAFSYPIFYDYINIPKQTVANDSF